MSTEFLKDVKDLLDQSLRTASGGASVVGKDDDDAVPMKGVTKVELPDHGPVPTDGEWKEVGALDHLTVYQIKSTMGTPLDVARVTRTGLESADGLIRDRALVVMEDVGDGKMMRIRISDRHPSMVLIQSRLVKKSGGELAIILSAPGMDDVEVALDRNKKLERINIFTEPCEAVDVGDAAGAWLTEFLFGPESSRRLRLMWHHKAGTTRTRTIKFPGLKKDDMPLFADISVMSLLSEESARALEADVRERNGDDRMTVNWRRFRPNLLISGVASPNDEDDFEYVKIGSAILKTTILLCRCQRVVTDPDTGSQQDSRGEPLKTLFATRRSLNPEERKGFNRMPVFGTVLAVVREGEVRVGDKVYAKRWSSSSSRKMQ